MCKHTCTHTHINTPKKTLKKNSTLKKIPMWKSTPSTAENTMTRNLGFYRQVCHCIYISGSGLPIYFYISPVTYYLCDLGQGTHLSEHQFCETTHIPHNSSETCVPCSLSHGRSILLAGSRALSEPIFLVIHNSGWEFIYVCQ